MRSSPAMTGMPMAPASKPRPLQAEPERIEARIAGRFPRERFGVLMPLDQHGLDPQASRVQPLAHHEERVGSLDRAQRRRVADAERPRIAGMSLHLVHLAEGREPPHGLRHRDPREVAVLLMIKTRADLNRVEPLEIPLGIDQPTPHPADVLGMHGAVVIHDDLAAPLHHRVRQRERVDVAMHDIGRPDRDGEFVARAVHVELPEIAIRVLVAQSEEHRPVRRGMVDRRMESVDRRAGVVPTALHDR